MKYLSNMKDKVSIHHYKQWIIDIFYTIMMKGTMDGYFKMFKEMIEILLNINDWKCFTHSKIIDKQLLIKTQQQTTDPRNDRDMVDDKWCLLLQTMIDSFDDKTLLRKYDNCDESESKTSDKDNANDTYYCNQHHLMNKKNNTNDNDSLSIRKCNYCQELRAESLLSLECLKCQEYICNECLNSDTKLIDLLKNEQINQFNQALDRYSKIKQESMIKTVECGVPIVPKIVCLLCC